MISIVTAYYNRKKLFIRTLESIEKNADGLEYEVIAVDDGSDEQERLEDLQQRFSSLKVIRLEKENKWYKNSCIPFNIGFKETRGDIIIIQNPECLHFGPVLKYAKDNIKPGDYLSFGCYSLGKKPTDNLDELIKTPEIINSIIKQNDYAVKMDGENGWYNHTIYRPEGYHFCAAMHVEDLIDLGGFDERYALGVGYDDNELVYRIRKKEMNFNIIDDIIVLHQNHYTGDYSDYDAVIKEKEILYKRNRLIYENVTQCNDFWRVNFIETYNPKFNILRENLQTKNRYKNLLGNEINRIMKYRYSRKLGLYGLKILSKIKL